MITSIVSMIALVVSFIGAVLLAATGSIGLAYVCLGASIVFLVIVALEVASVDF
jgi:hypothetical protein